MTPSRQRTPPVLEEVSYVQIPPTGEANRALDGDAASKQAIGRLETRAHQVANPVTRRRLDGAISALRARHFKRAETLALAALARNAKLGLAWHVLGVAREKLGDLTSSLQCYEAAIKLVEDEASVAGDLGRLAYRLDMIDTAAKLFEHALAHQPGHPEILNNLACALRDLNRCDEAIYLLRPALSMEPNQPLLWNTLGTVLCSQGQAHQALTFFDEALRLTPNFARARYNRAYARLDLGDSLGALADCDAALAAADSDADRAAMTFAVSTIHLSTGALGSAWPIYESRLDAALDAAPRFTIDLPRWMPNTSLDGKRLLICAEQGLGDEVMFANVLPDVSRAVGPQGRLTIAVERRLISLFQRSFPAADIVAHRTVALGGRVLRGLADDARHQAQCWTPMASLMADFRPTAEAFNGSEAYLRADPARVAHWRAWLATLPQHRKIGLLWKSLKLDGERSRQFSPFEGWRPVLETPKVAFINLQYGDCDEELTQARERFGVKIWTPPDIDLKRDLDDVAALCCAVDLVIGFSNATLNLAGACGAPTWVITGSGAWTRLGTAHYPWYPQARAFVTPSFADWSPIMSQISSALKGGPAT